MAGVFNCVEASRALVAFNTHPGLSAVNQVFSVSLVAESSMEENLEVVRPPLELSSLDDLDFNVRRRRVGPAGAAGRGAGCRGGGRAGSSLRSALAVTRCWNVR